MKRKLKIKHTIEGLTDTTNSVDEVVLLDHEPPNLLSSNINMQDLVRTHYDKLNLTHIKYLLSLSDNDWKSNFDQSKTYSAKETKTYLKSVRKTLNTILEDGEDEPEREYTTRDNNRLYAEGGIQLLERNIRNFIQAKGMKDYDMVNAQPTILLFLTKKANLPHTNLQYFCDNRDDIFKDNKKKWKDFVNQSLFKDKPKPSGNLYIDGMIQEYLDNRNLLIHYNKEYINPKKKPNNNNPRGSEMSNILSYWECFILNIVLKRFVNGGINTLLFDGFYSYIDIPLDELNTMTAEYGIKWKVKPLETCYELPDDFNPNDVRTYKEQVKAFEKEVCFITFAESYKRRDEIDGSWKSMTFKGMREAYKNWRTTNEDGEDIDFMDRWLKDKNRVDYNRMTFHPYSLAEYNTTHKKEFNTFRGFKSKHIGRKVEDKEVGWFIEYLTKCFGWEKDNGDKVVKFLINYIAHLVKKPHKKIEGILVLRGYEGTGKDTLQNIVRALLGTEYVYDTQGMKDVITDGAFNDHLVDKLLVVMNEVKSEDGVKNIEGLKQKCTTHDLNVKEKYIKNATIKDLNNMIINSNNNCPVIISPTCRRYGLYVTNEELMGEVMRINYWKPLYENHIENEKEINILFTWLLQQDIEDFDFGTDRPITDAFRRLATKSISEPYLILYYYIKKHLKTSKKEWIMRSRLFNSQCSLLSKYILEKKEIKKITIKENMEKIPSKYISFKSVKTEEGCNCWVVKDPALLLERMNNVEFKYYDPNLIPLEQLDEFDGLMDD